jgi:hypothetical protein
MRWIVKPLFKLRLTAPLRRFGLPLPWIIEEIEQEWFAGLRLHWDAKEVELAFDTAGRIRGLKWVLGQESDTTLFAPLSGIGRRGGYPEFLRVYWFGIRMASILGATGADDLIGRVIAGDADASEEASAIHLLRPRKGETDLEVEPEVKVGARDRKPDFRIRKNQAPWVYVEVTKLHNSNASIRVQELLTRLADSVMAVERPFVVEIILNRDPSDDEEQAILTGALAACDTSNEHRVDIADVGSILVKSGDPRVVVPSPTPDDNRPRMAISKAIVGPGQPNRQLVARVPFADERAEDILRREARQLPMNECGLLMANVNSQPSAFESWSERVPERFKGGQHTRVAGVILFMHATTPSEHGLVWVPYVELIPNPHAAVPLPSWITETVTGIRDKTRRLTGRSD